jgi:aspartate-semialdehyde dehydrogenase
MTENGYNEEEMKMVKETHKIWGQKDVNITATCIRVPVMRAHAESINLEFTRDISEAEVSFLICLSTDHANLPTPLPVLSCFHADGWW